MSATATATGTTSSTSNDASTSSNPPRTTTTTTTATTTNSNNNSTTTSSPPFPTLPPTPALLAASQAALHTSLLNIGASLSHDLSARASNLHSNSAALERQQDALVQESAKLRKEVESLGGAARGAAVGLKELGNVQNWAEMLERDFLVLERTVDLVEREWSEGESGSGSQSDGSWESEGEDGGEGGRAGGGEARGKSGLVDGKEKGQEGQVSRQHQHQQEEVEQEHDVRDNANAADASHPHGNDETHVHESSYITFPTLP